MKLQITLDDRLAERCDAYADENYMSRSGLISVALTQYLNTQEAVAYMRNLGIACRKLAENKDIDPNLLQKVETYANSLDLLFNK